MEYTGDDIQQLLTEKLVGTISPADDALLTTLIQQNETIQQQWTQLQTQLAEAGKHGFSIEADEEAAWAQLQPGLKAHHPAKRKVVTIIKIATAAAATLLLVTGAFYFYHRKIIFR